MLQSDIITCLIPMKRNMELESQVNTEQEFGIFDIRQYNFTTYKCQLSQTSISENGQLHGGIEF